MIIVVTGLPRSGTTLAMRMLYRGGVQVVGDKVAFEDPIPAQGPIPKEFLLQCDNKAVKILDPLNNRPVMGLHYKFIYMMRDPKEMLRWGRG